MTSVHNALMLKSIMKLIILADGQGTLFTHILKSCQNQTARKPVGFVQGVADKVFLSYNKGLKQKNSNKASLNAEVLALITSNPKAPVIEKAKQAQVPFKILSPKQFASWTEWDQALCSHLNQVFNQPAKRGRKPTDKVVQLGSNNWIVLAGFLKKIGPQTLSAFNNHIINIHPSLLPRHGGKGMYGLHVHQSIIKAGDKKTGVSIHLVSKEYDQGTLLAQKEIPVSPEDTPESLQKKVKKEEGPFYIATLNKICNQNLSNFKRDKINI